MFGMHLVKWHEGDSNPRPESHAFVTRLLAGTAPAHHANTDAEGFEPSTPGLEDPCSIHLGYASMRRFFMYVCCKGTTKGPKDVMNGHTWIRTMNPLVNSQVHFRCAMCPKC